MSPGELTLPDQVTDPDLTDVRYYAEGLLRCVVTRDEDDTEAEKQRIYALAESVLQALYGPHVDELIRELRERYDREDCG